MKAKPRYSADGFLRRHHDNQVEVDQRLGDRLAYVSFLALGYVGLSAIVEAVDRLVCPDAYRLDDGAAGLLGPLGLVLYRKAILDELGGTCAVVQLEYLAVLDHERFIAGVALMDCLLGSEFHSSMPVCC